MSDLSDIYLVSDEHGEQRTFVVDAIDKRAPLLQELVSVPNAMGRAIDIAMLGDADEDIPDPTPEQVESDLRGTINRLYARLADLVRTNYDLRIRNEGLQNQLDRQNGLIADQERRHSREQCRLTDQNALLRDLVGEILDCHYDIDRFGRACVAAKMAFDLCRQGREDLADLLVDLLGDEASQLDEYDHA